MPATKLKKFLDDNDVRYLSIQHSPAYTSQETAAVAHVPGRELAKSVMFFGDGRMAMAVLPATRMLNIESLKALVGADHLVLATEAEFRSRFGDCEAGAMPPFGNLYDMKVYVDRSLAEDQRIAFNAGSHAELLQMDYDDFERLVHPTVGDFAYGHPVHA